MGVWIETFAAAIFLPSLNLSHPVWVCGLKLVIAITMNEARGHTLYGCVD